MTVESPISVALAASAGSVPGAPARRSGASPHISHGRWCTTWLYLAPVLVFIAVFKAWPTVWGVYLSFFHVRPYLGNQYVGGANYQKLFSDADLRAAVTHTVI